MPFVAKTQKRRRKARTPAANLLGRVEIEAQERKPTDTTPSPSPTVDHLFAMQPSKALQGVYRKLRLTTKDIKKGFYKGTGSGSMGRHTPYGGYKVDYKKVRTYVVPQSLAETKLTPFVTKKMDPTSGFGQYQGQGDLAGPRSPQLYLNRWKAENGVD